MPKTFALPRGPGREFRRQFTGELRLLPDGKSVYVHTFGCGIYLLRGLDHDAPEATLVDTLPKFSCGVPILAGHFWSEPVPMDHAVVSLDISDPEHPKQVSFVTVQATETPHWLAIDPTRRRLVMNSGGPKRGNRLFIINLDPITGALSLDDRVATPEAPSQAIHISRIRYAGPR